MKETSNLLIKNCKPVGSGHDGSALADIRIREGKIIHIQDAIEPSENEEVFDAEGAYASGGWMDMHVHFREPGFEHKETIGTGCQSAMIGGFKIGRATCRDRVEVRDAAS